MFRISNLKAIMLVFACCFYEKASGYQEVEIEETDTNLEGFLSIEVSNISDFPLCYNSNAYPIAGSVFYDIMLVRTSDVEPYVPLGYSSTLVRDEYSFDVIWPAETRRFLLSYEEAMEYHSMDEGVYNYKFIFSFINCTELFNRTHIMNARLAYEAFGTDFHYHGSFVY